MSKKLNVSFTHKNGDVSIWQPKDGFNKLDDYYELLSYKDSEGNLLLPSVGIMLPDRMYMGCITTRLGITLGTYVYCDKRFFYDPICQGCDTFGEAAEWVCTKLVEVLR